jgi:hypothetical protein
MITRLRSIIKEKTPSVTQNNRPSENIKIIITRKINIITENNDNIDDILSIFNSLTIEDKLFENDISDDISNNICGFPLKSKDGFCKNKAIFNGKCKRHYSNATII